MGPGNGEVKKIVVYSSYEEWTEKSSYEAARKRALEKLTDQEIEALRKLGV